MPVELQTSCALRATRTLRRTLRPCKSTAGLRKEPDQRRGQAMDRAAAPPASFVPAGAGDPAVVLPLPC
eukprot:3782905-Lingulodinium_polyedra.AAC.1